MEHIKIAAFTGPRPEKLPEDSEEYIKMRLRQVIEAAICEGFDTFLSGMCRGVDLWAAEIVLDLKSQHDIRLEAVVPFCGQERMWPQDDRDMYERILAHANAHETLSEEYYKGVYYARNRRMVERCHRLIAVMSGKPTGGTGHTVGLAQSMNREIIAINPDYMKLW